MMWDLLALALIVTNGPSPPTSALPQLRAAIVRQAEALELVDPREGPWWPLGHSPVDDHPEALLRAVRARWIDLRAAPGLGEARRLPGQEMALAAMRFGREYQAQVEADILTYPHRAEHLEEVLREARRLYRAWELIYDGGQVHYYVSLRRRALADLKELVGEDAFYRGEWPPWVPVWRFATIP